MIFENYTQLIENGLTPTLQTKRQHTLDILSAALAAVDPYNVVANCFNENRFIFKNNSLSLNAFNNIYLVGFGKASIRMAKAVADTTRIKKGIIITNYNDKKQTIPEIEICIGGHPLPTQGSIDGAKKIVSLLQQTTSNDLVIVVISGGGSALFCHPRPPLTEIRTITDLLLQSGADITEINTIRKHLSYVKGGQLVRFCRAPLLSLIISDVVNDPVEFIASGPTTSDPTTYDDAKNILNKYHLWQKTSPQIQQIINDGIEKKLPETPKTTDPIFSQVHNYILANNTLACEAAHKMALKLGYTSQIISTSLTGEAREAGKKLSNMILAIEDQKMVLISGGETTVTVCGTGRGGRNQELLLSMVPWIAGREIVISSFATDGIDGASTVAGAIADGHTLLRAQKSGMSDQLFLDNNDSNRFFLKLDDTLSTGPTGTNVMDIQVMLR